jgi:hypothetical protein
LVLKVELAAGRGSLEVLVAGGLEDRKYCLPGQDGDRQGDALWDMGKVWSQLEIMIPGTLWIGVSWWTGTAGSRRHWGACGRIV